MLPALETKVPGKGHSESGMGSSRYSFFISIILQNWEFHSQISTGSSLSVDVVAAEGVQRDVFRPFGDVWEYCHPRLHL